MTKLQNAYDTISDPAKRRAYDLRWPSIRDSEWAKQESEKRQAEAAQAETRRTAETRAKKQEEDNTRQERLRNLESARCRYDNDIFELSRVIRKLVADLKRLQDQDDNDIRKERERNSWWTYLASPINGRVEETEQQKQERETNRLNRGASKRIKGSELAERETKLQRLQDALNDVNGKIAVEKKKVKDEKRRVEEEARASRLKMEQEARVRAMREMREKMVQAQKERAAKEAREAQAARERLEALEKLERARVAAAAERRRKEAEERAQTIRRAEEAAKKAEKARGDRSGVTTKSTCRHERFWPKIEGRQLCSKCHAVQSRFVFQCPGCRMVACASCRQSLRGGKRKGGVASGRQYVFARDDDYDCDISYYDYD